jgi:AcrR family transcriptional regulator
MPEKVAGRAGILKATFLRYFKSLGAMRYDAVARMLERFPLFHVADPGQGPLGEHIERFVALRVAFPVPRPLPLAPSI